MKLLAVDTVAEARAKLLELVRPLFTRSELVLTPQSLGRTLAVDLISSEHIPAFVRSTVDGYAVRAADTAGAGEGIPAVLKVIGSVAMGADAAETAGLAKGITSGECAYVPTGGMLPAGADAMVMVEDTELFGSSEVGIYSPAAPGAYVIQPGDDLFSGTLACSAATRLGAAEIGMAAALGRTHLEVFARPNLCIISTGDELVAPDTTPHVGQVRDINSWALAAQAELAGFVVSDLRVVGDDEATLRAAVEQVMQTTDAVVVSGGSSQGEKDVTARVIEAVASTGILTHGLALKPGKPTLTGYDKPSNTLLVGLPGHPLSALMVFEVMLSWLLREAQGMPHPLPVPAILSHNLPSAAGKDTLQLVSLAPVADVTASPGTAFLPASADAAGSNKLTDIDGSAETSNVAGSTEASGPTGSTKTTNVAGFTLTSHASHSNASVGTLIATPVHTKSGLVSRLSPSSGYIWIDRNAEGMAAGTHVAVHLLKPL